MHKLPILIAIVLLLTGQARADEVTIKYVGLFVFGFFTSLIVHEAGHEIVARYYGENLEWRGDKWICHSPCENLNKIAIAGNLATAITGELLLRLPQQTRETPFVDGMQTFNAVNPIGYAYKDFTTLGGYGDYIYVSQDKENLIALHAASVGWRQFNERARKWMIAPTRNGLMVMKSF